MANLVIPSDAAACILSNREARELGHSVGAYDDAMKRTIGWFDHTTQTGHVLSLITLRESFVNFDWATLGLDREELKAAMTSSEGREKFFGGKHVPNLKLTGSISNE